MPATTRTTTIPASATSSPTSSTTRVRTSPLRLPWLQALVLAISTPIIRIEAPVWDPLLLPGLHVPLRHCHSSGTCKSAQYQQYTDLRGGGSEHGPVHGL